MNNEDKLDSLIKDALNDKEIDITKNIDDFITKTLSELPVKKVRRKRFIPAKVAAALLAIILGMGTVTYAYSGDISIVGDLVKLFEKKHTINPKFKEYLSASDIYKTKDKGVEVSLLGVMANEMGLKIVLKFDYDKDVKTKITNIVTDTLWIDDKEVGYLGTRFDTEMINENSFIKIINIDSKSFKDNYKIPVKFGFKYEIKGLSGVDGSWILKANIDNTKIVESTITKVLNENITTNEVNFNVEKFLINPVEASLNYKSKESEEYMWDNQQRYRVNSMFLLVDNEGRSYFSAGGTGTQSGSNEVDRYMEFYKNETMPPKVSLIPVVELYKTDKDTEDTAKRPLKPQKLNFGELGSLEIKQVDKVSDEIRIIAKKDGLAPLNNYLYLRGDKNKDSIFCENIKQIVSENKDEFIMVFKGVTRFQNYSIYYSQPYKRIVYRDKAITINITN